MYEFDERTTRAIAARSWMRRFLIPFVLLCCQRPVVIAQEPVTKVEPTHSNVVYGENTRNVLDFWQASPDTLTPLVVFIHGGGFQSFSKERIRTNDVRQLLSAGISVAAVNYRYVQIEPFPACFDDARRSLQFLRLNAQEWNIDKTRIGAYGGSAGAMLSMWLAFHDDMADRSSDDPIEHESTRLACVATQGGQITFDRHWMEQSIPGNMIHKNPAFLRLFGVKRLDDLDRPEIRKWVRELSPITHLTADDPPIYMEYGMPPSERLPTDRTKLKPWALHHVIFGLTLKTRMDALGIDAVLKYPGHEVEYRSIPDFFVKNLTNRSIETP